jgi:hypothetical protein
MNLDFVVMNLTGFTFYSLYCSYGYFIKSDQTGQVDLNDVVFAYHAFFATFICVIQAVIYPRGKNRVHIYTFVLICVMWAFVLIWMTITLVSRCDILSGLKQ